MTAGRHDWLTPLSPRRIPNFLISGLFANPHFNSSCFLTSAYVHVSQVGLPLPGITNQRVVNLYDLMDSAYDSPIIREHGRLLNHVPIIDINSRRNIEIKLRLKQESKCLKSINKKMSESLRYNIRSRVERVNGRLKDEFVRRDIRVRVTLLSISGC